MGEEAFEEAEFRMNQGTVFVRGGYGRERVVLGIARSRDAIDPDVLVELNLGQVGRLYAALRDMLPTAPTELCWFCEATIELPIDRFGGVYGDREVTCHQCKATLTTAETEDDDENLTVGLAPVRCGHGIDHDEHCARCAAPETGGRNQRT